jgi:hypothetical protein
MFLFGNSIFAPLITDTPENLQTARWSGGDIPSDFFCSFDETSFLHPTPHSEYRTIGYALSAG